MMDNEIELRARLYDPSERRHRAALLAKINKLVGDDYAMSLAAEHVNEAFAAGKMTFEEKASVYTSMYGLSLDQQLVHEEAQRQSYTSVLLEGFSLDNEVLLLAERVLIGEITMDQKLALIKQLYAQ